MISIYNFVIWFFLGRILSSALITITRMGSVMINYSINYSLIVKLANISFNTVHEDYTKSLSNLQFSFLKTMSKFFLLIALLFICAPNWSENAFYKEKHYNLNKKAKSLVHLLYIET